MHKEWSTMRNLGAGLLCLALLVGSGCSGGDGGLEATAASQQGACSNQGTCPVANAGSDQKVQVGLVATLDGSESYAKTPALLTYQWTLTSKPKTSIATLANATAVRPTLTPDVAGAYSAKLVVNNGGLLSNADSVTISAAAGDLAPIANAGPDRTVLPGAGVTLNGSGTDPDGQPITTFAWTMTQRPAKSAALLLNANSATASFTGDIAGTYKLSLIVGDGAKTSTADQVVITVATGNIAPVANAGPDQNPPTGQVVTLTGSGSADANGNAITYNWRFESQPAWSTATLTNGTTATPTFAPDFVGFYVLALVVNDGLTSSPLDFVVIEARLPSFVSGVLQQAYVKASNSEANDQFGDNVALSGDTLAVGANGEGSCADGIGGDQADNGCALSGAVYVFTRAAGVWTQQAYVKASNSEFGDSFGTSVALSGDTLAVGAGREDSNATGIGGNEADNSASEVMHK